MLSLTKANQNADEVNCHRNKLQPIFKTIYKHWHFTISNNNLLVTVDQAQRYLNPDPLSPLPLPEVPPNEHISIKYKIAAGFCVYFCPRDRGQVLTITVNQ